MDTERDRQPLDLDGKFPLKLKKTPMQMTRPSNRQKNLLVYSTVILIMPKKWKENDIAWKLLELQKIWYTELE